MRTAMKDNKSRSAGRRGGAVARACGRRRLQRAEWDLEQAHKSHGCITRCCAACERHHGIADKHVLSSSSLPFRVQPHASIPDRRLDSAC